MVDDSWPDPVKELAPEVVAERSWPEPVMIGESWPEPVMIGESWPEPVMIGESWPEPVMIGKSWPEPVMMVPEVEDVRDEEVEQPEPEVSYRREPP